MQSLFESFDWTLLPMLWSYTNHHSIIKTYEDWPKATYAQMDLSSSTSGASICNLRSSKTDSQTEWAEAQR